MESVKLLQHLTATTLIHKFGVAKILFTGVAGSISSKAHIGDIVIENYAQHDLDASPFFPKYEIPILGKTLIEGCEKEKKLKELVKALLKTSISMLIRMI